MKCWHPITSMLMIATVIASATAAEQVTPWGYPQTTATSGAALSGYQNGYGGGVAYGAPVNSYGGPANSYGAAANGYGMQTNGAPNYSAPNYSAPNYGAPNYGAPNYGTPSNGGPMVGQGYGAAAPTYTGPIRSVGTQVQEPAYTAPATPDQAAAPAVTTTPSTDVQAPTDGTYAAPSAASGWGPQAPFMPSGTVVGGSVYNQPAYTAPVFGRMAANWGGPAVAPAAANPCPNWFGGVYGLIMDRDNSDVVHFGVDPNVPSRLYLCSDLAEMSTSGGVEARIGKTFDCCRWGLEVVYWQLFPEDEYAWASASYLPGATMVTATDYQDVYLNFGAGADTIDNYFNDGSIEVMEIRRTFDYQNVEVNLLSGPLGPTPICGCSNGGACGGGRCGARRRRQPPRWQAGWLFGVRYLHIDEGFLLGVDNGDGYLDYSFNGGDSEFFHLIDTSNDLVGAQLGMNLNYFVAKCFQLEFGSKFGIYANHMKSTQGIFNTNGRAWVGAEEFYLKSSDDDVSFLGELRAGLGYKVGDRCRLTGGYRAVVAENVALPMHQLNAGRTLGSLQRVRQINHDASLILHGAYAGLEFAW